MRGCAFLWEETARGGQESSVAGTKRGWGAGEAVRVQRREVLWAMGMENEGEKREVGH